MRLQLLVKRKAESRRISPSGSRIHERTISLRLGKILGVIRLEVSVYNVYIKNLFQTTVVQKGEVTVNSKEENSQDYRPNNVQKFGLRRRKHNLFLSIRGSSFCIIFHASLQVHIQTRK
jgi:hypothetical protein